MNSEKILSICIPTYNRGLFLKTTLEHYVNCSSFNEIEIVISDNCSTDDTETIVKGFSAQYSNVKYHRLNENIGADRNITQAMMMGSGKYLKLHNDNISISENMLSKMLDILKNNQCNNRQILFYQNNNFHSNESIICKNINELVSVTSFWITWIINFGIWRSDFDNLENKNKCADLRFNQVDWTLRMIDKNQEIFVLFDDFYLVNEDRYKGGYNPFKTFGIDYLSIYQEYLKNNTLSKKNYEKEKYKLFRYYLLYLYGSLIIRNDSTYSFEKNNALNYLLKTYRFYPYFYLGIGYLYLLKFFNKK